MADVDLDALSGSALVTLSGANEFTLKNLSGNTGGVSASADVQIDADTQFPAATLSTFGGLATVSDLPLAATNNLQFGDITSTAVDVTVDALAPAAKMFVTAGKTINIGSKKWSQGFTVGTYGA